MSPHLVCWWLLLPWNGQAVYVCDNVDIAKSTEGVSLGTQRLAFNSVHGPASNLATGNFTVR